MPKGLSLLWGESALSRRCLIGRTEDVGITACPLDWELRVVHSCVVSKPLHLGDAKKYCKTDESGGFSLVIESSKYDYI